MVCIKPPWGGVAGASVRFLSIIPDEVIHQFKIKDRQVIKIVLVEGDELLLDGAVESLLIAV